MLKEAHNKINEFKRALEQRQQAVANAAAIAEIRAQYDTEREKALAEVQALKTKLMAREKDTKAKTEARVKALSTELEEVKATFQARISSFAEITKKLEKSGGASLESLKAQHKKVCSPLIG